jgi:NDP-sugar pyrophosphorylase family protein
MDAIIMCAGLGTRMGDLTKSTPKPLLPVAGKGSLERTLDALPPQVTRVIIVVNYLAEQIQQKIGAETHGRPVVYVRQDPLDGTGGCLRQVRQKVSDLSDDFLVLNGDDIYGADDLKRLAEVPVGLMTKEQPAPRAIDSCVVKDGLLVGLQYIDAGVTGLINIGAYHLDQRWFQTGPVFTPGKTDEWGLPHSIPELVEKGVAVHAIPASVWLPVGTPQELVDAEKELVKAA